MKNLQFPVKLLFKISTLANDFTAQDAHGKTVAYVRQKCLNSKKKSRFFRMKAAQKLIIELKLIDGWIFRLLIVLPI